MKKYALDNLLRPPVEWWSSLILSIGAIALFFFPRLFLLTQQVSYLLGGSLISLSMWRFVQGYRVFRYQRNLRQLPFYALSSDELPINDKTLFLGKGFRWEAKHTQRLYDLKQSGNEKFVVTENESVLGGDPAMHGVEPNEQDVFINLADRVGHTMILGTTRVGKTRLLELLISSDIRRNDSAVIVLDPKGDPDLLRRMCHEAKQVGREKDVIVFHLGYPDHSARYNPIGNFARITEVANRIANQLPGQGESAAFKEFGWRFVNIIASAMIALGKTPNYKAMDRYILAIDPLLWDYCEQKLLHGISNWKTEVKQKSAFIDEKNLPFHMKSRDKKSIALIQYVDNLKLNDDAYEGLKAIFNYDQTYFQKITASLSPLFAKLNSGRIAELISPNYSDTQDSRPIFDWLQVIRGKKIVYVGLDALSDTTVASSVGNSMFADLCSTVGQIYKFGVQEGIAQKQPKKVFHKVNVYSDEFNELAGEEFIPLANKGGGAGLQLTVATQTASDVEARLGNRAKANQIFGNFNTLICLRVIEESTARLLTEKLPQRVQVKQVIQSSSVNDHASITESTQFTSNNEDRVQMTDIPLISTDDVSKLPKGQAFCLLNGGQLWKVRFPLPKNDMVNMPENVEAIVDQLTETNQEDA